MYAPKTQKHKYIKKQFFTDLVCSRYVLSAYCLKKKNQRKKKLKAASFSLQDTGQYLQSHCISIYEKRERIAREAFSFILLIYNFREKEEEKEKTIAKHAFWFLVSMSSWFLFSRDFLYLIVAIIITNHHFMFIFGYNNIHFKISFQYYHLIRVIFDSVYCIIVIVEYFKAIEIRLFQSQWLVTFQCIYK